MRKVVVAAAFLVLAAVAYIAAGPFMTLHEIRTAIRDQDSEKLSDNVDFPTLRRNLKAQLSAEMMKRVSSDMKGNPFGGLALALGSKLVDGMVDSFVTPYGLANLMKGQPPRGDGASYTEDSQVQPKSWGLSVLKSGNYSYDSFSRFSVWTERDKGKPIRFVLTREGFKWKLTNIIIPDFEVEGPPGAATAAGGSSQKSPPALTVEDVSSRVTEANGVFSKFAWKLKVRNEGDQPANFTGDIKFLDKDGYIVDEDKKYGMVIGPHSDRAFSGYVLIDASAARNVKKISATLEP